MDKREELKTSSATVILSSSDDNEDDENDLSAHFDELECYDTEPASVHRDLYKDIETILLLCGEQSVSVRVFETIDEIDVDLNIPLGVLDAQTSEAWGVNSLEPLIVRINFSLSIYLEYSSLPKITVFQSSKKARSSICNQVHKIVETFIREKRTNLANVALAEVNEQSETNLLHPCVPNSPSVEQRNQMLSLDHSSSVQPSEMCPYMSTNSSAEVKTIRKSSNIDGKPPKEILSLPNGFLVQLFHYTCQRIPTLSAHCIVCDQPHDSMLQSDMLKPSVCSRELCGFASQTYWVMADAKNDIETSAEVVDLLINLTAAACRSIGVFDPYPTVVDPNDPNTLMFDPKRKTCEKVKQVIDLIPPMPDITNVSKWLSETLDEISPVIYPLIQWIITSNRSHIVKLPPRRQLDFMCTPHQYLFLSNPPAKEAIFRTAKAEYGSTFAFHGSRIENWHSIIRRGLLNASGTRLQTNGAAYGKGIYLSPDFHKAITYSNKGKDPKNLPKRQTPKCKGDSSFLHSNNITGIAICEVIKTQDLQRNKLVWVCSDERYVCTRFLFVYEDGKEEHPSIDTQSEGTIDMIRAACCNELHV